MHIYTALVPVVFEIYFLVVELFYPCKKYCAGTWAIKHSGPDSSQVRSSSHSLPRRSFSFSHLFIYFKNYFIYLLLAALELRCCAWAFSSCGQQGLLFIAVRGLLIAVASLCCRAQALGARVSVVVACGLSRCGLRDLECRLSSGGARA